MTDNMNQSLTEQQLWWFEYGLDMGYPYCCVEAFVHGKQSRGGFFEGTGFVPCDCCYDRTPEDLLDFIDGNRVYELPFPYNDEKEFDRLNSFDYGRKVINKINAIRLLTTN